MNSSHLHSARRAHTYKGITLLEVLLYIALFSVISIAIIYLYISISKTATSIKINTQRAEVSLFVYEIVRYKLDYLGQQLSPGAGFVNPSITTEDFSRVLKYYPYFKVTEIILESTVTGGLNSLNGFKITYKISQKPVNTSAEKIFTHSFYVIM